MTSRRKGMDAFEPRPFLLKIGCFIARYNSISLEITVMVNDLHCPRSLTKSIVPLSANPSLVMSSSIFVYEAQYWYAISLP